MKQLAIILSVVLALSSCNSVKRNQKMLLQGNYDQAVDLAVKKIANDRNDQQVNEHIVLLEEAFAKAVSEDNRRITYLQNNPSPEATRELFYIYSDLESRQQHIRPLLPLRNKITGQEAKFILVNYNAPLTKAKNDFVASLYNEATALLNRNSILDAREAHGLLSELKQLDASYKNVDQLLEDAHFYGTDFVLVTLNNRSNVIIPWRLEQELLDFNTYKLDDFWTEYQSQKQGDIDYSFGITMDFREIAISPERVSEREFKRRKKVKDGFTYKLDRNGNKVKDENGNFIKLDVIKEVTARVTHTTQTKSVLVGGDVVYRNLGNGKVIDDHPLASEFIFENIFAKYRGDERALTAEDKALAANSFVPFPNNAQMVLDAGGDIKERLRDILKNNSFR